MKTMKKIFLLALIVAGAFAALRGWNDEDLFTTVVRTGAKPNVVFLQDVSGSMEQAIYHPDYDPNTLLTTSGTSNYGTINSATRTSWYIRWVSGTTVRSSTGSATISSFTSPDTIVLNTATTYIKSGDWILQYNPSSVENLRYQMVAKVTNVVSGVGITTLTLDAATIKGTPTVNYNVYIYSGNNSSYTTKIVTLYGTNIDQDYVRYDQDDYNYLKWLFTVANDSQRETISNFSTLGDHIDYNAYLMATPVSPVAATNPDNPSETLVAEWNRVWPLLFPSKIASLGTDITNSTNSIPYTGADSTFQGYTGNFYIKIDSETMLVNAGGNVPGSTSESGTLTVTRAQRNTVASAHASGAGILIFNQTSSPVINEYTPVTHLFSSTQHVIESTGVLDPTFTETVNVSGTNKTCWRYKRVFTRVQTSREALGDVITARNKLMKVAVLENSISSSDNSFTYLNGSTNFLTMDPSVATFLIKVIDPSNPNQDEVMLVTGHDSVTHTLTVTRAQEGTNAVAHNIGSAIQIYTGVRDEVILGMFTFTTRTPNTQMEFGLNDFGQKNADGTYKTGSYINTTVLDPIWNNVNALNNTPIAISLAEVWQYFKPSSSSSSPNYRSGENWSVVTTNQGFETLSDGYTHPKGSPMQFWCQNNYVVVVTDGQANGDYGLKSSTYGVFNNKVQRTTAPIPGEYCRWSYSNGWGDLDARDLGTYYNLQSYTRTYCPGTTCWLYNNGSDLLDDVAYFMYHQDMFPTRKVVDGELVTDPTLYDEVNSDPRRVWKGDQRISTYTVGLTIRNDMLAEAAANGHGLNFSVSNYQDLGESFLSILENIKMREDPMMYTTYAAPKQSVTSGRYGYVAHFVPRDGRSMWEGHLRRFRLGDDGNFPDNIDLLNSTNRGTVTVDGVPVPSYQWDVEESLLARSAPRVVYTAKDGARVDFNGSAITYTELGVANSTLAATVKSFITNFDSTYATYKYGDTFHFNPILVGYPLKWKSFYDASYLSFFTRYSQTYPRTEVVYVGANDGKLHCFASETGDELWSFIPPSMLTKLQIPALNPSSSGAHTYFVDGKALVKDIKVANYGDYRDWRTVLYFGMGIGGRSYCALDVTDPTDPKFLWEFDDGYSASNTDGRMGFTEAKPVIVDMNNGTATFPAAILPGGYNQPEVPANSTDAGIQDWIKKEGKALYILNAYTGAVVKKFLYGTSASNTSTLNVSPEYTCAMTAAPAVLDQNNDGIADYIYQADTGDYHVSENRGAKLWKISCMGDPLNWQPQEIYRAAAGQTFFISPSLGYDSSYRLLVMFGTGRRSQPTEGSGGLFTNLTGQFVCFLDTISASYPLDNTDLTDVTDAIRGETSTSFELKDSGGNTLSQGFYFNFVKASNEIMFEPSPLYLASSVYFMTFAPEGTGGGSVLDPCSGDSAAGGQHFIYNFGLSTHGNTVYINDPTAAAGKILGYGALSGTQYKLYIGQSNVGGFVSTATPPIELDNIFGPMLWKEEKHQ